MSDRPQKTYLGDSVYADVTVLGELLLTTENGLPDDPTNVIIIEPQVARLLVEYIERMLPAGKKP